jgi:competence protein ComEA
VISKLIHQIQHFFEISRKEARGTLLLMVCSFMLIWTPYVFRQWLLPYFPTSQSNLDTTRFNAIVADLERNIVAEKTTLAEARKKKSEPIAVPTRLFTFNPNTASVHDLEALGIPAYVAKRIEKYRIKGGQFRKKEELLRIYDFPATVYKQLEPYIVLPALETKYPKTISKQPPILVETKAYHPKTNLAITPFDINQADTNQLMQLKGIGSKLSARIIKFRDALGGFHTPKQYSEIFGLDSTALQSLHTYAQIGSPVKKISINHASVQEFTTHSYFRNKKQIEIIINYRNQHGMFKSAEELKLIKILDAATIEKMLPYLDFK